ncbi:gamma-aminobutyric acid receptor subunit beta-like [Acropora palmata]|uniref:gamma-aminobutyric acid receptor subunit beta-like n=1 Tax=Acropora palmata TaxID=6131 RepID=UPI003DA0A20B
MQGIAAMLGLLLGFFNSASLSQCYVVRNSSSGSNSTTTTLTPPITDSPSTSFSNSTTIPDGNSAQGNSTSDVVKPADTPPWEYRLKYEELVIPGRNVSDVLEIVFRNYDRRIRPFYGVQTLHLDLEMLILSFGEISETSMDFEVDLYLGQFWQDPRLAFGINKTIILGGASCEKFWLPDTFFVNSIDTRIHKMVFSNKKVWINLINGSMMLSARLVTKNSCKLDLRNYPLDEQTCHLAFESFSYEAMDLTYKWKSEVGSDIFIYDKEMAQFDIMSAKRRLKHQVYHSETFSGLTATMVFRRRSMYYIFQMYIPCVCIVALSWVSFWINHEAVPARVALSITTVLTISYMRGSVNAGMPRVSYLKSIDYFLLGGFVFIFMTLLEYVLVLKQSRKVKLQDDEEVKNNYQHTKNGGDDPDRRPLQVTVAVDGKSYKFKHSLEDMENGSCPRRKPSIQQRKRKQTLASRLKPLFSNRARKDKPNVLQAVKQRFRSEKGVHYLDQYSRILFPLGYAGFLTIYFVIYMKN